MLEIFKPSEVSKVIRADRDTEDIATEKKVLDLYIREVARGERDQDCVIKQSVKLDRLIVEEMKKRA